MKPLIVIAGPTASGKTGLSIGLAKALDGEIVSADSMQIYKYMNIGTAKPTEEEREGIPHHMMDFLEPDVSFSVADYCEMAHRVIEEIHSRGKLPILVGGTGLYIDSLVNNVDFDVDDENHEIRKELEALAEKEGVEAVHNILKEIDPETAEKYHPNNLRRVIRGIEFYRVTGKRISDHAKEEKISRYNTVYFCIDWDREVLYDRINRRVDLMVDDGLVDEVKYLLSQGYDKSSTAMQGIGYKEFYGYLDGKKTLDETLDEIKQSSRRYAKRQLTWFRRNKDIHWLVPSSHMLEDALEIISATGIKRIHRK
ncbi:MAG: tRNA (adenosine(37)-N6)-dimethylallyltransferase MiaA [Ruminococcaceae bacterium]|nr:tRNA (adenosine(37)-N6)-dimethylallyltransferase MiaA [Oscillospiraceae bacterium]